MPFKPFAGLNKYECPTSGQVLGGMSEYKLRGGSLWDSSASSQNDNYH